MKVIKNKTSLTKEDLYLFYDVAATIHAIRDMDEMFRSILRKIKKYVVRSSQNIKIANPIIVRQNLCCDKIGM